MSSSSEAIRTTIVVVPRESFDMVAEIVRASTT